MAHHDHSDEGKSDSDQHTDKSPAEVAERIWMLAEKIGFCMFVTWDGERQQARPLSARVRRDEHAIHFLVSAQGHKNAQIERFPVVNLGFADTGKMHFVSISGRAELSDDRRKIEELWSAFDKAWWDDASDPDIRLLTVTPERGELWDSPGKLVAMTAMLTAALTDSRPDMGDNATVRL